MDWYRKAWEGLWNAANDDETAVLERLATRAGLLWPCECGHMNPDTCSRCENCGISKSLNELAVSN